MYFIYQLIFFTLQFFYLFISQFIYFSYHSKISIIIGDGSSSGSYGHRADCNYTSREKRHRGTIILLYYIIYVIYVSYQVIFICEFLFLIFYLIFNILPLGHEQAFDDLHPNCFIGQ